MNYNVEANINNDNEEQDTGNQQGFSCEYDPDVFRHSIQFCDCSISPLAAFFGGIIA